MNVISSLVVLCGAEGQPGVKSRLEKDPRCEVVEEAEGKIGFVLETPTTEEANVFSSEMLGWEGVKDVVLTYHNFEGETP